MQLCYQARFESDLIDSNSFARLSVIQQRAVGAKLN